jgi:DNA-binding transcriptional MocR family regulator
LPPSRALAEQLRVHRSTVVNAYEELKARGILEARQGSKSYIAAGLMEVDHVAQPPIKLQFAHPANFVAHLWHLHQTEGIISLALGIPADELLPLQESDDCFAIRQRTYDTACGFARPSFALRRINFFE